MIRAARVVVSTADSVFDDELDEDEPQLMDPVDEEESDAVEEEGVDPVDTEPEGEEPGEIDT